ncbi:MAG: FMN-binding protein [Clostridia bacterium]|nr:FMN-binding protein [Clostridia bacterium]
MKNDKLKSVIVLTVICLIVTALLAVTNGFTAPVIEEARQKKVEASLRAVLPAVNSIREISPLPEGTPSTVEVVYVINSENYAVVLSTTSAYSSGDMGITVGISKDHEIVGVKLTSYFESKDFGREEYPGNFIGLGADTIQGVDAFAGVTYSSKAFKAALADAFTAIELIEGGEAE